MSTSTIQQIPADPLDPIARSQERRTDLLCGIGASLVVTAVALVLSRTSIDSYDGQIMGQVATGILDRHSIVVLYDAYHLNTPHSFYGILMSLLMIPGLLGAKLVGSSEASGIMITNVWLLGCLTGVAYAWGRVRQYRRGVSVAVALLVGLGMGMLPFAATGFAEVALALSIMVGLLGLSAAARGWSWGPIVVGAGAGAAIVTRDDSILLVAPFLVLGCLLASAPDRRLNTFVRLIGGGLPFFVLWGWYNQARYGSPLKTGYHGILVFNHPFFDGLYGLLLSPGKGLILYVPLVLVACWGLGMAWRRDKILTTVVALLVLSRILFYSPYWGWYAGGGFGPRYVLPAVPALALGLMEVGQRFGRSPVWARGVVVALALVSICLGVIGGAVNYETNTLITAMSREPALDKPIHTAHEFTSLLENPATQAVVDRHMFDWGEFPITDETSSFVHRDNIVSDGLARPADKLRDAGGLVLLALGLGALYAGSRRTTRRPRHAVMRD